MSEYQGNYNSTEPPAYSFTGSAPEMDPDEYFSFKPIPEGMNPIVDPDTRMCIGYMKISIGYDPTCGFLKYVFVYDVNEKEVDHYKLKLTSEDVDAMSPETLEEYRKFRQAVFDAEDHGTFGSSDDVWFMLIGGGPGGGGVKAAAKISQKVSKTVAKAVRARGSKTAAVTIFVLKSKLKMGLSPGTLKFGEEAAKNMHLGTRYAPRIMLEHVIRFGKRLPDPGNEKGGIYKMYDMIFKNNGKQYVLEVLVDEKTWTIKHFAYIPLKDFSNKLVSRMGRYAREGFSREEYLKSPADYIRSLNRKNQEMKDIYYSKSKIGKRSQEILNDPKQYDHGHVFHDKDFSKDLKKP